MVASEAAWQADSSQCPVIGTFQQVDSLKPVPGNLPLAK
jgi:hypothetical protein